jgi:hypothetical protein
LQEQKGLADPDDPDQTLRRGTAKAGPFLYESGSGRIMLLNTMFLPGINNISTLNLCRIYSVFSTCLQRFIVLSNPLETRIKVVSNPLQI